MSSEQTFVARVTEVWSPNPTRTDIRREVSMETFGPDGWFESSFTAPAHDCHWQVGDEVEIVLRKKTKETTHD